MDRCPSCRRELGTEMHKHLAEEHGRPGCHRAEVDHAFRLLKDGPPHDQK